MASKKWNFKGRRGNKKTTITTTGETEIVPAYIDESGGDIFADIYGLIIANTSVSACSVDIRDDLADGIRMTFAVPAGETRGFMVRSDDAHPQTVPNKPWTAKCSAGVTSIEITAMFKRNS